jgi:hypothetical protein
MNVKLSHRPNPDIAGGYWHGKPPDGKRMVSVESLAEASGVCQGYIRRNDLGFGNWTGGQVFDGKRQVAVVSYNGRIWDMGGKAIIIEGLSQ